MLENHKTQDDCMKQMMGILSDSKVLKYERLALVVGIDENNKPTLAAWRLKNIYPFQYTYYDTNEQRDKGIQYMIASEIYRIEKAEERKNYIPSINPGDIYAGEVRSANSYKCWREAYQVIEKVSKHYAHLRQIAVCNVPINDDGTCEMLPVKDEFISDDILKKKITKSGITIYTDPKNNLNTLGKLSLWDGKPDLLNMKQISKYMISMQQSFYKP